MEPLLGGRLAKVDSQYAQMMKQIRPGDTPARWALRWVGSHPNVLVTLSGMTTMDVLRENVATFSPLVPCTAAETALLSRLADAMAGTPVVPCTACRYCMPCPFGVNIPGNFSVYNEAVNLHQLPLPETTASDYQERLQSFRRNYQAQLKPAEWATQCRDCEACLPKCPQQIRIPNQLARIREMLPETSA
jgi:predicted aldo/keto reductase-like oxidoreductase